jgi:hypothetical protein
VIERAHIKVVRLANNRARGYEIEFRYEDFRDCDGLLVPAQVTRLMPGTSTNDEGDPVHRVWVVQWNCQSLGEREPDADDFAISFDPNKAIFSGIRNPQYFRDLAEIPVITLTINDLHQPGDPQEEGAFPPR